MIAHKTSGTSYTIKPIIDSVKIDTTGNNIFIKDNRLYKVYAHDPNGSVKTISASWNATTIDTAVAAISMGAGNGYYAFIPHNYNDTLLQGNHTLRFTVKDDDSISSTNKDTSIFVRLGPPVLKGDSLSNDTLWVPVDTLTKQYYIHVNSFDTNGVNNLPVVWYWNSFASLTGATITTRDSLPISFSGGTPFPIGLPQPRYIYSKDNDSLISSPLSAGMFVVYADSAPPAPVFTYEKPGAGQIRIGWNGKDTKDGNGTLFKVLLKKGSAPANSDILIDFTSGTSLSPGLFSYDFSYTFTPTAGNGTYYYQVIAKDARGSISSNNSSFYNYP